MKRGLWDTKERIFRLIDCIEIAINRRENTGAARMGSSSYGCCHYSLYRFKYRDDEPTTRRH